MFQKHEILETIQMITEEHLGYPDDYDGDLAARLL